MNWDIFRANDIRGIYGKDFDDEFVYYAGRAIISFLKCKDIIIGRDMRLSSPSMFKNFAKGVVDSGSNVIDIGLIDTPGLYFATVLYNKPGVMITASHNTAEYNGIKIVRPMAKPVDIRNGLRDIKKTIEKRNFINGKKKGVIIRKYILKEYKKHAFSFINLEMFHKPRLLSRGKTERLFNLKKTGKIKIVIDAGNGMAGNIIPFIYGNLDIKVFPLYFRLDGRFPNHVPNPIIKKDLFGLQKKVKKEKADFGIAFDGDMDRVTFVDEKGRFVNTSIVGAILARYLLQRDKKEKVIYTSATSRILNETILNFYGVPIREKVGHAFMKDRMRRENALFGMEHSGHYYYRDNNYSDSALITSLLVISIYSEAKSRELRFSDLVEEFDKYSQADEISIILRNNEDIMDKIERHYKKKNPKNIDHFDGLWIEFDDYWFSVRKSNTEPLLRINLEAVDKVIMGKKLKEVLSIIKSGKKVSRIMR